MRMKPLLKPFFFRFSPVEPVRSPVWALVVRFISCGFPSCFAAPDLWPAAILSLPPFSHSHIKVRERVDLIINRWVSARFFSGPHLQLRSPPSVSGCVLPVPKPSLFPCFWTLPLLHSNHFHLDLRCFTSHDWFSFSGVLIFAFCL